MPRVTQTRFVVVGSIRLPVPYERIVVLRLIGKTDIYHPSGMESFIWYCMDCVWHIYIIDTTWPVKVGRRTKNEINNSSGG